MGWPKNELSLITLIIPIPGLRATLYKPHTGPPDYPGSRGGRDVSHTNLRLPLLMHPLRQNKTRDRLTSAQALVH